MRIKTNRILHFLSPPSFVVVDKGSSVSFFLLLANGIREGARPTKTHALNRTHNYDTCVVTAPSIRKRYRQKKPEKKKQKIKKKKEKHKNSKKKKDEEKKNDK